MNDQENIVDAKSTLLMEMASETINALHVRELCRDNPGLIATAGLRIRIWTLLLLGETNFDENLELQDQVEPCEEQHVLEADVKRTRADMEVFRSTSWRQAVMKILQVFCISHKVQYLERYFCQDDSAFLFKAFRLFHLLLLYHDPQLAWHLSDQEFPPELYAPQWFMTLYSRGLQLPLVLRLWDILISVDDPAFTFFIGLCMLRRLRNGLLMAAVESIPEIISKIHQMQDENEIDTLVSEAVKCYSSTPRCFLRSLRLCCVSTPELTPTPWATAPNAVSPAPKQRKKTGNKEHNKAWAAREQSMAAQTARSCPMLSAKELVSSVAPMGEDHGGGGGGGGLSRRDLPQYVLIDIRSSEEMMDSGGGIMPRAIHMEPELLDEPDTLEHWLQHFDGTRGCSICIIDMPPSKVPAVALWRRLLLGEGDGLSTSIRYSDTPEKGRGKGQRRDSQSAYVEVEAAARHDDEHRFAVKLAIALQRQGFPLVSVLDGGFPALVKQLERSRGTVEPVIINHDANRWMDFLRATGRLEREKTSMTDNDLDVSMSEDDGLNDVGGDSEKVKVLTETEILFVAMGVANRMGHIHMENTIREKLIMMGENLVSKQLVEEKPLLDDDNEAIMNIE
eukprot:gene2101-4106_t